MLAIALGALALACATAGAQPIEASHPVVDFLRRLEEKGVIAPGFWSTLPRDAREVAVVLAGAKARDSELGAWDRRRLERYLDEFDRERRRASRLHYQDTLLTLHGGAEYFTGLYARDSLVEPDVFAFGSFTPSVEATYSDWGYGVASATVSMERTLRGRFIENYDPQRGMPYVADRIDLTTVSDRVATFDGYRLVLGVGSERIRLEAGQDWNAWGPGRWQKTVLGTQPYFWVADSLAANPAVGFDGSRFHGGHRRGYRYPGEGPPLPQVRFLFRSGHFEYVKIVAQRMGMDKDSTASLIAHRLQLKLGTWRFGFTETIALGTRSPDLVSLLPFVPLRFEEHSGGDRDNAGMGGDVEWIWTGRGRLYAELFLDDFSGLPLNYWSNKLAWTLGASFQDPLGLPAEVNVEYARVDPWVYGHKFYNAAMQSYGSLLGSSLPPNSHAVFASAAFPVPGGLEGRVDYAFRQRDPRTRGSSIFDVYQREIDPVTKQFLAGNVETRNALSATTEWKPSRFVRLRGGAGGLWVTNWNGNPGTTYMTPTGFGEVTLRY